MHNIFSRRKVKKLKEKEGKSMIIEIFASVCVRRIYVYSLKVKINGNQNICMYVCESGEK